MTRILLKRLPLALACLIAASSLFAGEGQIRRAAVPVPGEYIVVLPDDMKTADVPAVARQLATAYHGQLGHVWQAALKGFSVTMTAAHAQALARDARVAFVEESGVTFASSTQNTFLRPWDGTPTSDNREWHLDHIDENPYDGSYNYCSTGNGVRVYVVDWGVMRSHNEFATASVTNGYNAAGDSGNHWISRSEPYHRGEFIQTDSGNTWMCNDPSGTCTETSEPNWLGPPPPSWLYVGRMFAADDPCNGFPQYVGATNPDRSRYLFEVLRTGHGTSTASLVAGERTGAAKNVTIVPVKVGRCDQDRARQWKANAQYFFGDTVYTSSGVWRCIKVTGNGLSGSVEPSWLGKATWETLTDGALEWVNLSSLNAYIETTTAKIDAVNWITAQEVAHPGRAIATFSIYTVRVDSRITAFETAVKNLIAAGVTVFASANNQGDDACNTSPGRLSRDNPDSAFRSKVITVGGTMIENDPDKPRFTGNLDKPDHDDGGAPKDARWICGHGDSDGCAAPLTADVCASVYGMTLPACIFDSFFTNRYDLDGYAGMNIGSNWGRCVTLFAPARNITSARLSGLNDYRDRLGAPPGSSDTFLPPTASGTSFSAPIAAGVAARFLENAPTGATPDDVYWALMNSARRDALVDTSDFPLSYTYPCNTGDNCSPNVLLRATNVWIYNDPPSLARTSAGYTTTTLALKAAGPGTLTYQWYEGAPGDTSNPLGTAVTQDVTPSSTLSYWARVSCNCNSAASSLDSPAFVVTTATPPLGPPANVTATTSPADSTHVTISWQAPGTDSYQYQLQRSTHWSGDAGFVNVGSPVTTLTASDVPPGGAATTYVYRVIAIDAGGHRSVPSNRDYATVAPALFTNEPIVAGQTHVKSEHLTQLRNAVDAVHAAARLSPVAWSTLPTAITGGPGGPIAEIRQRLDEARNAMQLSSFPYNAPLTSFISAASLRELRDSVR